MNLMLSNEDIERYRTEGVLAPLPALTPEEVLRYREAFEEVERLAGGRLRGYGTKQLHLYMRWAHDLALHPVVLDAVESLLGSDILVHDTSFFCKYPDEPSYVSWHQDGYYMGLRGGAFTTAWVALTRSGPENGCMRVIPRSHVSILPHVERPSASNMLASGMTLAAEIDEGEARDVILRPGEMSLHHVNLIHSSRENHSGGKRIGFAIRYISAGTRQKLPHHQVVLARGEDRHGHFEHLEEPPAWSTSEAIERQREGHAAYLRVRGFTSPAGS